MSCDTVPMQYTSLDSCEEASISYYGRSTGQVWFDVISLLEE